MMRPMAYRVSCSTYEGFRCKMHYPSKSENLVSAGTVLFVAQRALSARLRRAEVSDLWQNALSAIRKTCDLSECTEWI